MGIETRRLVYVPELVKMRDDPGHCPGYYVLMGAALTLATPVKYNDQTGKR